MKRSFVLVIVVVLAVAAAALAPVFKEDPGLVQIQMFGWTVQTSVLVLAIAILLIWLLASFIIRLWKMPAETARKLAERRALNQLEKGLLALTEGDWRTAERALEKSTNTHGRNTARFLAAAQAADGRNAPDRADWYLEQAEGGGRREKFLVALTRARILCGNGQFSEAVPVLEELRQRRRRHPQVLELLAQCYDETGNLDGMQEILPALIKAGVVDKERASDLSRDAAISKLRLSSDLEELSAAWQSLSKNLQRRPEVVRVYADEAVRLGGPELTEEVLRSALKREWNSALLLPYGDPGASDTAKRLKQCEKWLLTYPDDAMLHLALGRLCASDELWGKARKHLIRSLELEPTIGGYDSLGQLLDRMGELELAMACFRNALRMSQGKEPEPLPGDQAKLAAPGSGASDSE